jgi:FixJ family two-component response regulator
VLLRRTIFIIDDDPSMLRSIERLLKVHQFDVKAFESAEAALDSDGLSDAGCLVLDIDLGGMSGIELKRHLVGSGVFVPVIFITGKDSETVRKAALEVGCAAYLSKPFAANQLTDAIEKAWDAPEAGFPTAPLS